MASRTVEVDIPEEIVALLKKSKLGDRPIAEQLRIALAIHLLQEGVISTGKAASIAGEPRAVFELLIADLGLPAVTYTVADYESDKKTLAAIDDN